MAKAVKGKVKLFLKDEHFGQVKTATDRSEEIPKNVEKEVDYRTIRFKSGEITFKKGVEVTKDQLSLMSDYQKKYYLG